MRVAVIFPISVVLFGSAGCDQREDRLDLETLQQPLRSDRDADVVALDHPEIGGMGSNYSGCTATLVAPRWVLTAGHCVGFTTHVGTGSCYYKFSPRCGGPSTCSDPTATRTVIKILNFGPTQCPPESCCTTTTDWAKSHLTLQPDHSGTNDVALLLLDKPVPASVATPAPIATNLPSPGETVRTFGWGELPIAPGIYPVPSKMRYVDWTYHVPDSFGDYYYMPDVLVEGDSGGPSIFGPGTAEDGQIWAVNSVRGTNQLGAVVALRPQICAAMYAEEPHTWGSLGAPLIVPISGCQSLQSPQDVAINTHEVISAVCAAHANCCDPTGYWDSSCVTAGDQAYNSINFPTGCFAAGTGSNWTFGSIGTTGQQYPADFTVFALGGNVTSNYTEIRGAVAGQGKVTANSFSINFPGLQPVGLVAGGNVELGPGGTIYGNIYYGGPQKSIAPTVAQLPKGTTVTQGSPIRFGDVGPALTTMSQTLSTAPTQIAVVPTYGNLLLSSSSPGLNVFSLHQADLQKTHSITLAVPFSSTVIINVDGTAPTITSAGIKTGGHDPGLILWNFYQATALNVSYCTLMGSVLAPNADAVFRWGVMWGTLVAKSVDSTTEFHQLPFRNNCLVP